MSLLLATLLLAAPFSGVPVPDVPIQDVEPRPAPPVDALFCAGPHALRRQDLELHDAARDKPLLVRVTWPTETEGRRPVVIWSHGMFGSRRNYQPLAERWASHGFVVVQPTHLDSLELETKEERRKAGSLLKRVKDPREASSWRDRVQDVAFLLEGLPSLHESVDGLGDLLDPARVGVGGHSFGAHTTLLSAGATAHALRRELDLGLDAARAFVAISPQAAGGLFERDSFGGLTRPMLFVSGSEDLSPRDDFPVEERRAAFDLSPAGARFLLWIDGADHSFGGISRSFSARRAPAREHPLPTVQATTLAFWKAYLEDDEAARRFLDPALVARVTKGVSTLEQRTDEQPGGDGGGR